MAIASGSHLGPYEIISAIGSGGMGEVYRGKDTRLGREVAIKILPAEFAENQSRIDRFEQEARSASALNHPNIITIYDIGRHNSSYYMAMEFVDGKTLRDVMNAGPIPARKIIGIAVQIADGLAKAHAAGIIHRDLKPENIMLTKDGFCKILDFGLAKLTKVDADDSVSSLRTSLKTGEGMIVGTVSYMSPEQASGQSVDFRSDQFSFGSILYEMTTGKRPFQKKTPVETMAAILNEDPESVQTLNAHAPAILRWTIERCMAKDPDDRYASSRDLARDLQSLRDHFSEVASSSETAVGITPVPRKHKLGKTLYVALPLLALLAAAGLFVSGRYSRSGIQRFHRLTYPPGTIYSARFAPDGKTIIYSASFQGNQRELYQTRTEGSESRPLGIKNSDILSISDSGEMLILTRGESDHRVLSQGQLSGGSPRPLLENVYGASWNPDGKSIAVSQVVNGQTVLQYPVGKTIYKSTLGLRDLGFSREGDLIAFVEGGFGGSNGKVVLVDPQGKRLAASEDLFPVGLAWSPSGKEVWFTTYAPETGGGYLLVAIGKDGRQRTLQNFPGSAYLMDATNEGSLLLAFEDSRTICLLGKEGENVEKDISCLDLSEVVDISKDGQMVLIHERGEGSDSPSGTMYVRKTDGSAPIRLSPGGAAAFFPDEKKVLGGNAEPCEIMLVPTGAGQIERFSMPWLFCFGNDVFPDGNRILVQATDKKGSESFYVLELKNRKEKRIQSASPGFHALIRKQLSPDGNTLLLYAVDHETYLVPVQGGQSRKLSGIQSGELAFQWSADGSSVYVCNPDHFPANIYKINISTGKRDLLKTLQPPDVSGVGRLRSVFFAADEKTYAYSYGRDLSTLYLVREPQ
jgi:serine/threonine protein kinase